MNFQAIITDAKHFLKNLIPPGWSPHQIVDTLSGYSPQRLTLLGALTVFGLLAVWFWVRMVLDSFRREYDTMTHKTLWRTVTLLLFLPGALVYFFKVYNTWTLKQYLAHHIIFLMITGAAMLVATSTYGTLWYFNKRAEAQATATNTFKMPLLDLDPATRTALLNRPKYGAPLSNVPTGGRLDPFAPIPGQAANQAVVTPSLSPSPSPSPTTSQGP